MALTESQKLKPKTKTRKRGGQSGVKRGRYKIKMPDMPAMNVAYLDTLTQLNDDPYRQKANIIHAQQQTGAGWALRITKVRPKDWKQKFTLCTVALNSDGQVETTNNTDNKSRASYMTTADQMMINVEVEMPNGDQAVLTIELARTA